MAGDLTILHVLAPAKTGGLESVVRMLASGHAKLGHRVVAAACASASDGLHPFVQAMRGDGVETLQVSSSCLNDLRELYDICRSTRPMVIHTHGYRSDVLGLILARRLSIHTISTVHGFTGGGPRNSAYEMIDRLALRGFDAVVAVSNTLGRQLGRYVPRRHLHVVRNAYYEATQESSMGYSGTGGADLFSQRHFLRAQLGVPDTAKVVGWVGRLSWEKGADVMIRALALCADNVVLALIGDGPERSSLEQLAVECGVAERIVWCGSRTNAAGYFPAFDVFALSSRTEGTPIVLFEAMAASVPIVATRVGGVPDVLSDREGKLVPAQDHRALASGIMAALSYPYVTRERAAAARARLRKEFSITPWLNKYEELYRQIIQ